MKKIIIICLVALLASPLAFSQRAKGSAGASSSHSPRSMVRFNTYLKIKSATNNSHLHNEYGYVSSSIAQPGWHSSMWILESVPGTEYVRIKNRWKNTYLHIEHGKVEDSHIGAGAHSSMWLIERVPGTNQVRIKNRWKNTYLNRIRSAVNTTSYSRTNWILEYL